MARRHVASVMILAAGAVLLAACSTPASSPPKPTAPLWKVTSAHRTLYITGAVGASLEKYPVPAPVTQAFAESGELILEGTPKHSQQELQKLKAFVMKRGLQPSGQTLSGALDPSQLALVKKAFSAVGFPFAAAQHFRPWMAVVTLHGKAFLKLGIKPHQLYMHFYNKADAEKMPVTFLNKDIRELELFAGMPRKVQVAWLTKTAKDVLDPKHQEKRARGIQAWERGDTTPLAKRSEKMLHEYPQLYKILVASYEPRWLKTLEAKLNTSGKPVFVIVNADNLVGPTNILKSLQKAGYKVVQQ